MPTMTRLFFEMIILISVVTYTITAGLFFGMIILMEKNIPPEVNWGIVAGFWPVTMPLFTLFKPDVALHYFAKIVGEKTTGILKPKPDLVLCDLCRKQVEKGVYR